MSKYETGHRSGQRTSSGMVQRRQGAPGKRTRIGQAMIWETARAGIANTGGGGALPHGDRIQRAFGRHDLSEVRAHVGGAGGSAAEAIGAEAYATGSDVAFRGAPDLHTAAHEAAHVVQQRKGLALDGGVGSEGDAHEQHADAVADRVVAGASAEDLLDAYAGTHEGEGVQMSLLDGIAQAGVSFVDLLKPKMDLKRKITDLQWIIDLVDAAKDCDAHPRHKLKLHAELTRAGFAVGMDAVHFGERIASCGDLSAVQRLEAEFDAWKLVRAASIPLELELIIESYRQDERAWMQEFIDRGQTPLQQDPAFPNKKGQPVALTFTPKHPESEVTVETRVHLTFARTLAAILQRVPAITPQQEQQFAADFQAQLDAIWTTAANDIRPFRLSQPGDHLLANETPKWSDMTAKLIAKVTPDASDPHFKINVWQPGQHEKTRANVGPREATFFLPDAVMPATPGDQPTLAHEWHHMIGNPDEYSENASAAEGDQEECMEHFDDIIDSPFSTLGEVDQARRDKDALINQYDDTDPTTSAIESRRIYDLQGRDDVPDVCFAERSNGQRLRPGEQSQRGGTNISSSMLDEKRLSDGGIEVRPYMREGIVEELRSLLEGAFTARVAFDHNFKDMAPATVAETNLARVQNRLRDVGLGPTTEHEKDDQDGGDAGA